VSIRRHRVVMTSRRCDVLRGSWCAAAGELALRLLSCTSMSFQAGDDGSITRLRRTAVCCGDGAGGRFPSVSLDTLLADISTDAAFCARSVVWRVYHERSDRRSQEQRNAARVREHPVHASISSPPCRLLSSAQGPSQPWHRECTIRYVRPSQRGGYNIVSTRSRLACWRHSGSSCSPPSAGSS
jgi:hypothetical protein